MYLNCHTYFSLRYGTLSPEQLVQAAKKRGVQALALTDINNTSCAGEFVRRCRKEGIKPLLGIDFRKDGQRLYVGIARNREGFCELNQFLSDYSLHEKPLPEVPPPLPNCYIIYPKLIKPIVLFKENEFLGVRPEHLYRIFSSEVRNFTHKLVALNPATFLDEEGWQLHRLLRAIDRNTLITKLEAADTAKPTEFFHYPDFLEKAYALYPKIIENTRRLMDACEAGFEEGLQVNRQTFTGSKEGDFKLLEKLALVGCKRRYGENNRAALERMQKELKVIKELDFCPYFLITWDIVRYAGSVGYHHIGRGSGANSIVAYCIGITDVEPLELDLYFERFINPHRSSPPDFDIDFSWDERDDVTDYIFKRYGREHTALLATYSTFQFNAAVRELGKCFGLPKEEIDSFADEVLRATGTEDVQYWKIDRPKFEDVIARRIGRKTVGFGSESQSTADKRKDELLMQVQPEDLIKYGLI
ncbi:MAG: PHP domain-containing protein, partial [Bacteroidota bacterium]